MSNTKTSRNNNNSLSMTGHDSAAKHAGTNPQALAQALKTYEIPVGPGSYNLPDLINKPQVSARNRNGPCPTIGVPRPRLAVNPETRSAIPSVTANPSPSNYQVPTDNSKFKRSKLAVNKECKFFEPTNMPKIREQVPVQYTSIDGMAAKRDVDLNNITSRNSSYLSNTVQDNSRYK